MSAVPDPNTALPADTRDQDPQETREWLDALSAVISTEGRDRAHYLLDQLLDEARHHGVRISDQSILEIWHLDLELNAQGLAYWLESQEAA